MPLTIRAINELKEEVKMTNELLRTLITLQQPVQEVVSNIKSNPNPRGPRNGNQKQ